jgi:SAM-dependent methyltransferase
VAPAWAAQVDAVDVHAADATTALLDEVAVRPGERVLELAAGPGSLAGVWSDLVGPSGSVVVSDLAPGMVELARSRSAAHANVEVRVLDAAAIDAPDASFDVVACRMGLMFTPDPSVALAEVHRVLRPGGRLGALTWGGVEHNPWMTCVGMAAMATGLVQGGPPTGPGGIFSLGDPDELGRLAEAAGFAAVDVTPIELTFRAESAEAHVAQVASLAGPLAAALQAASADQVAALHRTAATLAAPYLTGDGLAVPGRALLLSGRR